MEAVAIGKAAPGTDIDMFCDTPENSRTFGYGFLMWSMVVFLVCLTLDTIHDSSSLPYIDKRNLHLAPTVDVLFFIDTKVVRRITCVVRVAARDFQLDWKSTQKLDQQTMNTLSGTTRNARRLFSVSGFLFNAVDLKIENPPGDITVIFAEASVMLMIQLTGICDLVWVILAVHSWIVWSARFVNCIMRCHMLAIVHIMLPGNRLVLWCCDAAVFVAMIVQTYSGIPGYVSMADQIIGSVFGVYLLMSLGLAAWTVDSQVRHTVSAKAEVILIIMMCLSMLTITQGARSVFDSKWLLMALYAVSMTLYHSPAHVMWLYQKMADDDNRESSLQVETSIKTTM